MQRLDERSRMSGDVQVRICEHLRGRFPWVTRLTLYVSSERSAIGVLESLTQWIEKHLKLSVNQNKSGTGRPWDSQFLGFRIS